MVSPDRSRVVSQMRRERCHSAVLHLVIMGRWAYADTGFVAADHVGNSPLWWFILSSNPGRFDVLRWVLKRRQGAPHSSRPPDGIRAWERKRRCLHFVEENAGVFAGEGVRQN
jgi:hypothetical protein